MYVGRNEVCVGRKEVTMKEAYVGRQAGSGSRNEECVGRKCVRVCVGFRAMCVLVGR